MRVEINLPVGYPIFASLSMKRVEARIPPTPPQATIKAEVKPEVVS